MKRPVFFLPGIFGLITAISAAQTGHFPTPPPPLDNSTQEKAPPTDSRRIDLTQLQREADILARTAQTIPSDVASVRKGMLPKDVIEKLKQIEKLSKHLRSELNP